MDHPICSEVRSADYPILFFYFYIIIDYKNSELCFFFSLSVKIEILEPKKGSKSSLYFVVSVNIPQ